MPKVLKDIRINEVSSVDRGAGEGVKMLLMKRDKGADVADDPKVLEKQIADAVAKAVGTATADMQTAIAKLTAENTILKMSPVQKAYFDAADADTKKAFAATPEGERDAYMKKNPKLEPAEDPAVAALRKSHDKLAADNAEMAKRLGALVEADTKATFEKRAVAMGLKADDGDMVRKAFSGDTEAGVALEKKITETTKALDAARKLGGLFKIVGDDRSGGDGATAYDKMKAKASDFRKTADGAKLSPQQAFEKVYEDPENRELRDEVMAESAAKRAAAV